MDNSYFSKKITFLNVFLTFCIVTMHSIPLFRYGYELDWNYPFIYAIYVLTQIAVPMFFFISGLLFYKTCHNIGGAISKIKSRVRTLLVPYLLWNAIFVFIYFSLSHLPITQSLVSMGSNLNSFESVVWGILNSNYTVLWFVRNLIFYTALAPIILCLISKKYLREFAFLVSLLFMFYFDFAYDSVMYWIPVYLSGCIYGYYFDYIDNFFFEKSQNKKGGFVIMSFLLFLLYVLCLWDEKQYINIFRILSPFLIFNLVNGCLYNYLNERFTRKIWMSSMFFIYCCHHFLLTILQKSAVRVLPHTDWIINVIFIISPILVIGLLVAISNACNRFKVYKILTGGR